MSHLFNRTKKELYVQYQKEMEALVEDAIEANALSPEDQELQRHVPEPLRLSYTRQQLLCLRAAQTNPPPLKCYDKGSEAPAAAARDWSVKEAEQLDWAFELEKTFEHKKEEIRQLNPQQRQMYRLQSEAVHKLRASILEAEKYKKEKMRRERHERRVREAEERGEVYVPSEEEEEDTEKDEREAVRTENIEIVEEGGRSGASFTAQRWRILEQMDRELQEEELARKVKCM